MGRVRTSPWKVSDLTEKLPKSKNPKQDLFHMKFINGKKEKIIILIEHGAKRNLSKDFFRSKLSGF